MYPINWTSDAWSAFGNVLLAVSALVAGIWSVYHFWHTRRLDAAKWLKQLFTEFYIENKFVNIQDLLTYHYKDGLGSLIERRITDRHLPVSSHEIQLLRELDTLLNYFELLLYLEDQGHLSKSDRNVLFEFWFGLFLDPACGGLRRYVAKFGYERLAKSLQVNVQSHEYIAFYGSLMDSLNDQLNEKDRKYKNEEISKYLKPIRTESGKSQSWKIHGCLYELGDYPGLVPETKNNGMAVVAELYEVTDLSVFQALDKFEKYNPTDIKDSLFVRRCIRLANSGLDAWVYFYNKDVDESKIVSSGDWHKFCQDRKAKKVV